MRIRYIGHGIESISELGQKRSSVNSTYNPDQRNPCKKVVQEHTSLNVTLLIMQ